jgi:hypothetical protein
MTTKTIQRIIKWTPTREIERKTPSFGDLAISSPSHQKLTVELPYEEGTLSISFNDARAFFIEWDGDQSPFLTANEAQSRPSDLCVVLHSRWLASEWFHLDCESSAVNSGKPWMHYCVLSGERTLHVAARSEFSTQWSGETSR